MDLYFDQVPDQNAKLVAGSSCSFGRRCILRVSDGGTRFGHCDDDRLRIGRRACESRWIYKEAFRNYENILRKYIARKQQGAERFAAAFAPKTRGGLFFRNQVISVASIPGFARLTFGRDITDTLQLPPYRWPVSEMTGAQ